MAGAEDIRRIIVAGIESAAAGSRNATRWRKPLVGFAPADDPRFPELRRLVDSRHALPGDILEGARAVVAFFLPFDESIIRANAAGGLDVAREWAVAYVETNALIDSIARDLGEALACAGVRAAAEPATGRFDRATLTSTWSHKSAAVIAGLGSIGVHRMLITDAGCAGRAGSLVLSADLGGERHRVRERCRHLAGTACLECVARCPIGALAADGSLDKQRCWDRCRSVATGFADVGLAEVCGKCAVGACAVGSAAPTRV